MKSTGPREPPAGVVSNVSASFSIFATRSWSSVFAVDKKYVSTPLVRSARLPAGMAFT